MKPEDLEELIEFGTRRLEDRRMTVFTARLIVESHAVVTDEFRQADVLGDMRVKTGLIERIMRRLYDDQRDRLMSAIMDFMACDPMDVVQLRKAREELLYIASRQEPERTKDDKIS